MLPFKRNRDKSPGGAKVHELDLALIRGDSNEE